MPTDERLTELEIRYAHLEQTVSQLSAVMYDQQKIIDALSRTVLEFSNKLKASDPGLVDGSVQERPPHY